MCFIDCDTHILECDATWDHLEPSERHHRPQIAQLAETVGAVARATSLWLVGDTWARRWPSDARPSAFGKEYTPAVTHLEDASVRLREMDALGVDVQILISTFFIGVELAHPHADAAITRAYNRWVAERTAPARDRLRWLVVPPLLTMERALEELEFGAESGAAGVMLKGVEHGKYLNDSYFFPMYERAEDLGLAMCVHLGTSVRDVANLPIGNLVPTPPAFLDHSSTIQRGFYAILSSGFDKRFPRLKWSFLESGSTWVPSIFQQHQRLVSTSSADGFVRADVPGGTAVRITKVPRAEMMAEKQLFVACQGDEDLPYVTELLGAGSLVFGTDYSHNDVGADPLGHTALMLRDDLDRQAALKIVDDNARQLFGIPTDFRPAGETGAVTSTMRCLRRADAASGRTARLRPLQQPRRGSGTRLVLVGGGAAADADGARMLAVDAERKPSRTGEQRDELREGLLVQRSYLVHVCEIDPRQSGPGLSRGLELDQLHRYRGRSFHAIELLQVAGLVHDRGADGTAERSRVLLGRAHERRCQLPRELHRAHTSHVGAASAPRWSTRRRSHYCAMNREANAS